MNTPPTSDNPPDPGYLGLTDAERRSFSLLCVSIGGVAMPVVIAGCLHHGVNEGVLIGGGLVAWSVGSVTAPYYLRPLLGITFVLGACAAVAIELLRWWP